MKSVLTVTGSGCVALGHPARPPQRLPKGREPGRTPLLNSCFELLRRQIAPKTAERASDADTLEEEDSRSFARDGRAGSEQRYRLSVAPMP
jgi:hypothetical protein